MFFSKVLILLVCAFYVLIGSLTASSSTAAVPAADDTHTMYPNVRKLNDNLYAAKMPGELGLNLVMERVNASNKQYWQHYAAIQYQSRIPEEVTEASEEAAVFFSQHGESFEEGESSDLTAERKVHEQAVKAEKNLKSLKEGSQFFLNSLLFNDDEKNELWVAYITSGKPQNIPESIRDYKEAYGNPDQDFAKDIKMFVTMVTSRNAVFTMHMGVTASIEGCLGDRPKNVSVDLHSFAAKVALILNPKLLYQINQPILHMGDILIKAIDAMAPGNVFVGDKQLLIDLIEREKSLQGITFERFISPDFMAPDVIAETCKKSKLPLETRLRKLHQKSQEQPILHLMYTHPPILSVDGEGKKLNRFIILKKDSPEQVLVEINRGDPNYDWVFNGVFSGLRQPFVVVDLHALAAARPVVAF